MKKLGILALLLAVLGLAGCKGQMDAQTRADYRQIGEAVEAGHRAGARSPQDMALDIEAMGRIGVALDKRAARDAAIRVLEGATDRALDWAQSWAGAALVRKTGGGR